VIRESVAGLLAMVILYIFVVPTRADDGSKPNVIVILADDLGRGDYSAFGAKDLRTPAIDRLYREGMAFENFYANSCVCSPTRAALLTGCFPDRVGVPGVIRHAPDNSWGHLSPRAVLLPQVLKPAGYHSAIVGKWHLGLASPNIPTERGFDSFQGFLGDMMDDYVTHRRGGANFMRRNEHEIDPPGHATDLFTDWACEYLEQRASAQSDQGAAGGQPFFLYLAYNAPHDPIQPPAEVLATVRQREPGISDKRAGLVAQIEHMDAGIGKVLGTLDRLHLTEKTLVFFTSDNGGVLGYEANNGPWRSEKQHLYEGGLRVPAVARWPGHVAAGRRTDRVALTMDLFATIAKVSGAPVPADTDGVSFLPTLLGQLQADSLPSGRPRELYFVRREGGAVYGGKTIEGLIRGDWKIVQDSPFQPLELYNLKSDPREAVNRIGSEPQIAQELSAALRRHIQRGGQVAWQAPAPE
jgi:arylsulfatase A-like enzyme